MTVLSWTRPARRRDGTPYDRVTKRHVSIDGTATVCGYDIPQSATVMAVTPDWHELTTCYNCAYRLWPDHAPPGYVRPVSGSDFPPRRECPHHPGHGRDPRSCATCTPPAAAAVPTAVRLAGAPAARRTPRDPGHPAPDVIRRWHIPLPLRLQGRLRALRAGGQDLARGELVNNEYQGGVMHAACPDPPYLEQPDSLVGRVVGFDYPDPPASGDTVAAGDPFNGTEFTGRVSTRPAYGGTRAATTTCAWRSTQGRSAGRCSPRESA